MTETERWLLEAKGIVQRVLGSDASEAAVMQVFDQLCCERDADDLELELPFVDARGAVH